MATTIIDFWTWIWSTRHCVSGQEVACWFQCWKNWFHVIKLITLVLMMWKLMDLFFMKNNLLRCWGWLSLLIGMGLWHYLYCLQGCEKEALAQVFSCEFSGIFKNTFFTEHLWTTASAFSFSEAATRSVLWKKVFLKIL